MQGISGHPLPLYSVQGSRVKNGASQGYRTGINTRDASWLPGTRAHINSLRSHQSQFPSVQVNQRFRQKPGNDKSHFPPAPPASHLDLKRFNLVLGTIGCQGFRIGSRSPLIRGRRTPDANTHLQRSGPDGRWYGGCPSCESSVFAPG